MNCRTLRLTIRICWTQKTSSCLTHRWACTLNRWCRGLTRIESIRSKTVEPLCLSKVKRFWGENWQHTTNMNWAGVTIRLYCAKNRKITKTLTMTKAKMISSCAGTISKWTIQMIKKCLIWIRRQVLLLVKPSRLKTKRLKPNKPVQLSTIG